MKISNYKPNQTIVETQDYTALLSYGVPQVVITKPGFWLGGGEVFVNSKRYSTTTSKHKNAYVRKVCASADLIVPASREEIQEMTGLETR